MQWTRNKQIAGIAAVVALAGAFALSQGGRHHMGGMGMGFGPGPDHILAFMTDALDLTDAQQTQAKAILDREKPTFEALASKMSEAHKQLSALGENGTFDEASVRALANQNVPTMVEMIVQTTRVKSELYALLTPEQKAKASKIMQRHQDRMMQHMHNGGEGPGL